jgi:hypothetical protein
VGGRLTLGILVAFAVLPAVAAADQVITGVTFEAKPREVELRLDDQARAIAFSFAGHPISCAHRTRKAARKTYEGLHGPTAGAFFHSDRFTRRCHGLAYVHKVSISGETVNGDPESWAGSFKDRVEVRRDGERVDRCTYAAAWLASS